MIHDRDTIRGVDVGTCFVYSCDRSTSTLDKTLCVLTEFSSLDSPFIFHSNFTRPPAIDKILAKREILNSLSETRFHVVKKKLKKFEKKCINRNSVNVNVKIHDMF